MPSAQVIDLVAALRASLGEGRRSSGAAGRRREAVGEVATKRASRAKSGARRPRRGRRRAPPRRAGAADNRADERPVFLRRHSQVAAAPPRSPAALLVADAERRQGVDPLEEIGLPYEAHRVAFDRDDQKSAEFAALNPYQKIPAILDPSGPGGRPLALFESGAILLYLAEKTGDPARGPGAALRDDPVADVPGGRRRADVRPGRLLPQIRRQGFRRQAAARPLRRRGEAPARRARRPPRRAAPG